MGSSFDVVSPADGKVCQSVSFLSLDEAKEKLGRAEIAFQSFRKTKVRERVELLKKFLDAFDSHQEEFARELSVAMGKPVAQAKNEIAGMRERTLALCASAPVALAEQLLPEKPGLNRFVRREPLGVVLDIAAWNYPYVVAINVIAPAILAGNAVLLKHAEQTHCAAAQIEKAFIEAGAPEGLVQNLMAEHDTVRLLLEENRIAHVGFTGSVAGGREVYGRTAAGGLASCSLELGGKDAAIVLPDADLKKAAAGICDGAFYNAGQSCCGVERIYVPRALHDEFVRLLVDEAHRLEVGSPLEASTSLGPVVHEAAAKRINAQVEAALSAGAKLATDDARFDLPTSSNCYLPPRVLTHVSHEMDVMSEETFGPVVGVMAYDSLEEAVRLANDSKYGLTASVWSEDEEAVHSIGDELEVGTVYMNRCDAVDADLPWIGVKESGLGFTLSHWGIERMTRPKSFNLRTS